MRDMSDLANMNGMGFHDVRDVRPAESYPGNVKCLLVDDLEENLLVLTTLMEAPGIELLTARSGPEALELLLRHEFALALIDVQMPGMDGFELAELIRGNERSRDVPLILVTAGSRDPQRLFAGYDKGAVDFLYKPIEPQVLKNKAAVFFQLYRQKRQLAQQVATMAEALRMNELFTAMVGHDLRNPLSAILMSARLLQRLVPEGPATKAAGTIVDSGLRMGRMIDDILDLARIRSGSGLSMEPAEVDLTVLFERVLDEHRTAFPGCRIEVERLGDLGGRWDGDRLDRVMSNLLGNALQHGDAGQPVRVRIDGTDADVVTIRVGNSGHIPSERRPFVFDAFTGGDGYTRAGRGRGQGLGLGLFIVRQIVVAHRGSIDVDVEPQRREVAFTVRLPRRT